MMWFKEQNPEKADPVGPVLHCKMNIHGGESSLQSFALFQWSGQNANTNHYKGYTDINHMVTDIRTLKI